MEKCDAPRGLRELLRGCDGVVGVGHHHGNLVAARLLQDPLQLPDGPLHGSAGAQVHFTDHDEDGNFERHGQAQVLPRRSGWMKGAEGGKYLLFLCKTV